MSFLNTIFWGVRLWIWFYFIFSILMGCAVAIYWFRERIRKTYYSLRFPEKLIKVVMHYKGGLFREYWRLIPTTNIFEFEGKHYHYEDNDIIKNNDFYSQQSKDNKDIIKIEGKTYLLNDVFNIKLRRGRYPEIHYFYNNPNPIEFNIEKKKINFSSEQLAQIHENDLIKKLLTLEEEKNLIKIVMIIGIINVLISGFIVAKLMGWIT